MFQVPASKRSIKQNRFEFEVDGEQYEVPLLKYLPAAAAEAMEAGKSVTALMMATDTDSAKAALRSLDGEQLEALFDAWQEASGIEVGESPASSD